MAARGEWGGPEILRAFHFASGRLPVCEVDVSLAAAFTPGTIAALVVAVSFAAGLNVYATLLTLGVMARMHWVVLPSGLDAVANGWVIGASALLYSADFIADKVPGFDLIWNAAHTFVRVPVAALLAYGASSHLSPEMQLLATVAGAAVASAAHGSKMAARVLVTPSPEPVSNTLLSGAEDVGAIGLTWMAVHHPFLGSAIVACLLVLAVALVRVMVRSLRTGWRRLREQTSLQMRRFAR